MGKILNLTLLLMSAFLFTTSCYGSDDVIVQRLAMPNVEVPTADLYMCTALKMDPADGAFVIGFEPNATMDHIHHVFILGCQNPYSDEPVWDCSNGIPDLVNENGVPPRICASQDFHHIYGFDLGSSPTLNLPEGVGFEVGGNSGTNYFVLTVHYATALPPGERDSSGIIIYRTKRPLTKRVQAITLSSCGSIPAHSVISMDAVCDIGEKKTIHPIAYKTHTHDLGMLVSGYFVTRNVSTGLDKWTLIGERDPQLPQNYIPIEGTIDINVGDRLTAQCWMNNTRDYVVKSGLMHHINEMCIFDLWYWVEDEAPLKKRVCTSAGPPEHSWANSMEVNNIPEQKVPASG